MSTLVLFIQGPNLPNPVDGDGNFTAEVADFKGRFVKEADKDIIAAVKVCIVYLFMVCMLEMFVEKLYASHFAVCRI